MSRHSNKTHQAFLFLQVAFVILALFAGLDKFFSILTDWSCYISPFVMNMINNNDCALMMTVGVIEIIVAIGLIFKPKLFAKIVAIWLFLIVINLLMGCRFDMALKDFVLGLSALALGKLSHK